MRRVDFVALQGESVFENAVLHHYRNLFDSDGFKEPTFLILTEDLNRHELGQSELWQALQDPETAARDLVHRTIPETENDLGWKDRTYASPSGFHHQDESLER